MELKTTKINNMKNYALILISILFLSSCYNDSEEDLYGLACETENMTYAENIEKIINNSCATSGCHVSGTGRHIYDSYSNLKLDIDNGTILDKVITNKTMPPGGTLSDCDYKMIDEWLKQGAKE